MLKKIPSLPGDVAFIIEALENCGYEAYAVGGCVRDLLLGREPGDWDICTSARPEQTKLCFAARGCAVIETGLQHGTVTVQLHGAGYEITTYRVEGAYTDHRRPDSVEFVGNVKEDLARRDFTINAMAYHPRRGLIDFFGGQQDLEQQIIRCVGTPEDRFGEDALRIMRALRFASTYGFEIEKKTAAAALEQRMELKKIAAERIRVELVKLLMGKGMLHILREYWQILNVFMPEIEATVGFQQKNPHHCADVWTHMAVAAASSELDQTVRLTMLFHDMGKPQCYCEDEDGVGHFRGHSAVSAQLAEKILQQLKFDRISQSAVVELVKYHDAQVAPEKRSVKRWLNRIGEIQFRRLLLVKRADLLAQSQLMRKEKEAHLAALEECLETVISEKQCFSLRDLHINGRDLIEMGITQGTEIGQLLHWVLDEVIEERLENKKEELQRAVEHQRRKAEQPSISTGNNET